MKFVLGIALLPAAGALSLTVWELGHRLLWTPTGSRSALGIAFGAGYLVWLLVFALLPKPMRTYVLAHELTHALWALLMGARVSGLRVRKSGGQVRTSKSNWLIVLAPYFFPLYALVFLALFFVAHWIWDLERYLAGLFFLVGLGWSFHITFTLMMLLQVDQPDVQSQGWLFSIVVIYGMNLVTIALTAVLLSRTVTLGLLAQTFGRNLLTVYGWTLDNFAALWHALRALGNRAPNPNP